MNNQPKHLFMLFPHSELLSSLVLCMSTEKATLGVVVFSCNAHEFEKWLVPVSAILVELIHGVSVSQTSDAIEFRVRSQTLAYTFFQIYPSLTILPFDSV